MPASMQELDEIERRFNVGRREFLTFCAGITATMGLPRGAAAEVAEAITKKERPSRHMAAPSGVHRLHRVILAR